MTLNTQTATLAELQEKIRSYTQAFEQFLSAEARLLAIPIQPASVVVVTAEALGKLLLYVEAFRAYRYTEILFLKAAIHSSVEDEAKRHVADLYFKIDRVCESEESFRCDKLIYHALLVATVIGELKGVFEDGNEAPE
jgi:hypothetical protein